MSALDWIRSKANEQPEDSMIIPTESAGEGTKPGTWKIRRWYFKGRLPTKMVFQVKGEYSKLSKVESGDTQIRETIKVGGPYRSEFNNCEYMKTVYEYIGA